MVTILIADDEPHVRTLLRTILRNAGKVVEAADGATALELITAIRPAVAILDVMMPELTGLEVCQRVRTDPQTAHTGVIVVTANGAPEDRQAALAAGADHFVTKPFSPLAIGGLVCELLTARSPVPA